MIVPLAGLALGATLVVGRDAPGVQEVVELASAGDTVELPAGRWPGPVRIDRPLVLRGEGTIDGGGRASVVVVAAPGVVVQGIGVRSSGDDLSGPDACVYTAPEAEGAVLRGLRLDDCLFGIWVHTTPGVRIQDNDIVGRPEVGDPFKGDGIHLFDASGLVVSGNHVRGARDGIYVSATEDSLIARNTVEHQRYGIHYMYSYDNTIEGNVARFDTGGIALMESQGLVVARNVASDNRRHGILFRDVKGSRIAGNVVERNGEGLFFFSSVENEISGNRIEDNEIGARVWAGTERNQVWGNAFIGNRRQVYYVAASDQRWGTDRGGNYWSDQLAWDQDGDGLADRPYRVDSLSATILQRWPAAVLLMTSPALEILGQLQGQLPALSVPTILDARPLVRPPAGLPAGS